MKLKYIDPLAVILQLRFTCDWITKQFVIIAMNNESLSGKRIII